VRPTIAVTAILLACPASAGFGDPSAEARLAAGEVLIQTRAVAGSDIPEATVEAVADAPPAAVWRIIDDCANYKRTMPRISESRLLSRTGNISVCEVTVDMPMPTSDLTSVNEATATIGPPLWRRAWRLLRGDYKRNGGSWTLSAFDAAGTRTRIVYKVHAEPNTSVPAFIIRKAQQRALPELIERVRAAAKIK